MDIQSRDKTSQIMDGYNIQNAAGSIEFIIATESTSPSKKGELELQIANKKLPRLRALKPD
jgi:hypothetical protein